VKPRFCFLLFFVPSSIASLEPLFLFSDILVEICVVCRTLMRSRDKKFGGSGQAASNAEGLHDDGRVDNAMTVTLRHPSGSLAMQTHQMTQVTLPQRSRRPSPHNRSMTTCDRRARRQGIG
jgi:hypothetical protein